MGCGLSALPCRQCGCDSGQRCPASVNHPNRKWERTRCGDSTFFFCLVFCFPSLDEWERRTAVPASNTCIHWSRLAVKKRTICCSWIIILFMKINLWGFCFKKAINLGSFETNDCTMFFSPSWNSFSFFCFAAIHLFSTHYDVVRKYFCQYLLSLECFYSLNLTLTASFSWCFVVLRFLLCVKMDKSLFNFIRQPSFFIFISLRFLLLLLLPKAMDRRGLIKWDAHFEHVLFLLKRMKLFLHLSHFMFRCVA